MVRTADVNRGGGLFYSKSCKATHEEKRNGQYKDYLDCKEDNDDILDDNWGHPFASGYEGHGQE